MSEKYFVWIKGLQGPEAQLWNDEVKTGDGKDKPHIFKHKLELSEEGLSLSSLALIYANEAKG